MILGFDSIWRFISFRMKCVRLVNVCACVFVWESVNDSEMSLRLCLRLVLFFSTSAHSARRLSIYWNNRCTHTHTHIYRKSIADYSVFSIRSINCLLPSIFEERLVGTDSKLWSSTSSSFSQFELWRNERLWRLNYAIFNWILVLQACFNDSNVLQTTQLSFEL